MIANSLLHQSWSAIARPPVLVCMTLTPCELACLGQLLADSGDEFAIYMSLCSFFV
jgi:hypothetical protein